LGILADLRETAVETGDRELTDLMHSIRRDTIEYLWQRLDALTAETALAAKGVWTEAEGQKGAEPPDQLRLAVAYMQGILASARILVQNGAAGLAPRVAAEVAWLRSQYGEALAAVCRESGGAGDLDALLVALESALAASDLPVSGSSLSAIESSCGPVITIGKYWRSMV
jgi:hypothetical protein